MWINGGRVRCVLGSGRRPLERARLPICRACLARVSPVIFLDHMDGMFGLYVWQVLKERPEGGLSRCPLCRREQVGLPGRHARRKVTRDLDELLEELIAKQWEVQLATAWRAPLFSERPTKRLRPTPFSKHLGT